MHLLEPIFVDRERTHFIYNQLPKRLAKPSFFKLILSLPPKLELSGEVNASSVSEIEIISTVRSYFDRHDAYSARRPGLEHFNKEFVLEVCEADQIIIPERNTERPILRIWISEKDSGKERRVLMLLEDFRQGDEPARFAKLSTFSALACLVHYERENITRSALGSAIPNKPHLHKHARFDSDDHPPYLEQMHNIGEKIGAKSLIWKFHEDWRGLFAQLGCINLGSRKIEVMYRVRASHICATIDLDTVHTFGYPLWIFPA